MYRICERQNHTARSATDAEHLDFGVIISQICFFCNTLLRYKNFTLFYKNLSISWLWILHKVAIINLVREKNLVLAVTAYINSNENAEIS